MNDTWPFPFGYAALLLGLPLAAVLGAFVVTGIISGFVNPLLVTVRYERIPAEMRDRVFSTFSAIAQIAQPLGIAIGGWAIDVVGLTLTVSAFGLAAFVLALGLTRLPILREMDRPQAVGQNATRLR